MASTASVPSKARSTVWPCASSMLHTTHELSSLSSTTSTCSDLAFPPASGETSAAAAAGAAFGLPSRGACSATRAGWGEAGRSSMEAMLGVFSSAIEASKREPRPYSDSHLISPPMSSMSCCEIASPTPAPRPLRAKSLCRRAASSPGGSLLKSEKSVALFSGLMPMPVSSTLKRMCMVAASWSMSTADIVTQPRLVNCSPFSSRWDRICCSRCRSPMTIVGSVAPLVSSKASFLAAIRGAICSPSSSHSWQRSKRRRSSCRVPG